LTWITSTASVAELQKCPNSLTVLLKCPERRKVEYNFGLAGTTPGRVL